MLCNMRWREGQFPNLQFCLCYSIGISTSRTTSGRLTQDVIGSRLVIIEYSACKKNFTMSPPWYGVFSEGGKRLTGSWRSVVKLCGIVWAIITAVSCLRRVQIVLLTEHPQRDLSVPSDVTLKIWLFLVSLVSFITPKGINSYYN